MQDEAAADLRAVAHLSTTNPQLQLGGLGWMVLPNSPRRNLTSSPPSCRSPNARRSRVLPANRNQRRTSWLSPWSVIGQTFLRCRETISKLPVSGRHRNSTDTEPADLIRRNPELAHLESSRPNKSPAAPSSILHPPSPLHWFTCATPEAEATLAAREIRRFVRAGGRYRETAVLVRSLDGYADTLRRIFARYDIPIFLDRRESVAHHPLAELTRYALRTVAFGWRQTDWFGALKPASSRRTSDIDWLENTALEHGWEGNAWQKPIVAPENLPFAERAERLRQQLIPFLALAQQTAAPLSGLQLAATLRELWTSLTVEKHAHHVERCHSIGNRQSAIGNSHDRPRATHQLAR